MPDPIIIIREPNPPAVVHASDAEPVVIHGVGTQGPAGPPGPPGPTGPQGPTGADQPIVFPILTPATTWIVTHGLGYRPEFSLADSTGRPFIGAVYFPDDNTLVVSLGAASAGEVFIYP